jgi:3-oxoacyl-[acyl-carrier protein] reductase
MLLTNKVALVTGGSSGIGFAVAKRLAAEGATVAVVGTNLKKAESAATEIRAMGGAATAYAADVGNPQDVERVVDEITRAHNQIDILVNSAGLWRESPLGQLSPETLDQMINVNLKGPFLMVNAVAPQMKERRSGRIVNLASVAGLVASPGYSLYSSLKAAVVMFTKAAALDLAPFDIAVNAVAPGNTSTPMNEHIRLNPDFAARRERIAATTPSNRPFTPPEEIAEAVLFLASGVVNALHGTILSLDEGRAAGTPAR